MVALAEIQRCVDEGRTLYVWGPSAEVSFFKDLSDTSYEFYDAYISRYGYTTAKSHPRSAKLSDPMLK